MTEPPSTDSPLRRRADQRFAVQVDAEVTTEAGPERAVTRDLSRGGVCFVLARPLERGATFGISLSLVLGENMFSEPLRLRGAVIWCTRTDEGYQIGASLTQLSDETRQYLQMFLGFLAEGVALGQGEGDGDEGDDDDDDRGEKGLFG
jgi:hypothetical protein